MDFERIGQKARLLVLQQGCAVAQWVEHQIMDPKGQSFNPTRNWACIFLSTKIMAKIKGGGGGGVSASTNFVY